MKLKGDNPDEPQTQLLNHAEDHTTFPAALADQAGRFFSAAKDLHRRAGCSAGAGASGGVETASLADWAASHGFLIAPDVFETADLVSNSTSEHEVRYRKDQNRAWKRTWAGFYGQIPCPENGRLERRNATPEEYLFRMGLQIQVFYSDIRLEGVSISDKPSMIIGQPAGEPSFVISQEWLVKSQNTTPSEIALFLRREGFEPVPNTYFGWYRRSDGMTIVDAKPDNFIITAGGLMALDLQMAVFTPEQAVSAGLATPGTDSLTLS